MKGMLPALLLSPDTFFGERMKEPGDLKVPGIIAAVGATIAAIEAYLVSGIYEGFVVAAGGEGIASLIGVFTAASAFFTFLILWWVIFAGLFYLLSMAFSGTGPFRQTLAFVGYGLVPVIIGSILTLLISWYYLPMVEAPVIGNIQDPTAVQQAMAAILEDPAFKEFTQVTSIVSALFLAWSGNLWIFGMKHARNLSLRNAIIVVMVPVIVLIGYSLATAFLGIPFLGGS